MRVRPLIAAIAMLSLSAAASADPAKAPVHKADQSTGQDPSVEIASADETASPAPSDQQQQPQADPAKPVRHARVSTCRCGDQTPGSN